MEVIMSKRVNALPWVNRTIQGLTAVAATILVSTACGPVDDSMYSVESTLRAETTQGRNQKTAIGSESSEQDSTINSEGGTFTEPSETSVGLGNCNNDRGGIAASAEKTGETSTSTTYRGNPDGVSCVPNSKWNADIDAGYKLSGADYDKFRQCLIDSGCFTPGGGFTLSGNCYKELAKCQKHLIGKKKAKKLKVRFKNFPRNASTWKLIGQGL